MYIWISAEYLHVLVWVYAGMYMGVCVCLCVYIYFGQRKQANVDKKWPVLNSSVACFLVKQVYQTQNSNKNCIWLYIFSMD